jgi:hypothetical protein
MSSVIIPNCRIGNFGSACLLDGNSVCFELKQPRKEAEASDADKAIVANATNKANVANEADEAKADEDYEAIVSNEAAEIDEAYLAIKADVAEAVGQ